MKPQTLADFTAHALSEFPKEACGLIIAVKRKEVYVPCRNIADDPMATFKLAPEDYANAEDRGKVMAVAHTHPNAGPEPSEVDRAMLELTELPWYVLSVVQDAGDEHPTAREHTYTKPSGYVVPLVGRTFVHGIHDCYTLIRDWWQRERSVTLPNYEREDNWWENGQNLYLDNFEAAGFNAVSGQPEVGDIYLMQIRSDVPNHAAVYIGDGMILHHMYNRLSTRDVYGGYWAEVTVKHLRYGGAANGK